MNGARAAELRELDPRWRGAWDFLSLPLRDWLIVNGITGPAVWAELVAGDAVEPMTELVGIMEAFCWPATDSTRVGWSSEILGLWRAARGTNVAHGHRLAAISTTAASYEKESAERAREVAGQTRDMKKLEVMHLAELPRRWICRRFRRRENAKSAEERQTADEVLRARWADQVVGLVLEANLPISKVIRQAGGDQLMARRCC